MPPRSLPQQFLAFLGVGAIATTAHYAVLLLLVEGLSVLPVTASALGALTGAVVSYHLNRNYTFQSTAAHGRTAPRFFLVAGLTLMANTTFMWGLTVWLPWPYLPAQILTTGLLILLTFGLNKFWSFR